MQKKSTIELLIEGDQQAFNALFIEYGKKLYCFSLNYLRSKEEAKEVVQEVFIKIWETRQSIDLAYSFDGLLFTIAYRIILNKLRKLKYENQYKAHVIASDNIYHNNVEDLVNEAEIKNEIKSAINSLPDKRRMIFRLIKEQHMSYQQVADHLKISVKTVEAQMTEALKYLRKRLATWCILIILVLF